MPLTSALATTTLLKNSEHIFRWITVHPHLPTGLPAGLLSKLPWSTMLPVAANLLVCFVCDLHRAHTANILYARSEALFGSFCVTDSFQ